MQTAGISENELLPEDGSAAWIVHRRDRVRARLVEVAHSLARLLLTRAQPVAAAQVCATALDADPYDDAFWRFLIEGREKAGDEAGARRALADYRRVVSELELVPTRS